MNRTRKTGGFGRGAVRTCLAVAAADFDQRSYLAIVRLRAVLARSPLLFATVKARARHPLADAALLDEVLLETANLLVEQVVRLVNQANDDIRHGFRGPSLDNCLIGLIGPIRPIPQLSHVKGLFAVFLPKRMPLVLKKSL